MAAKKTKKVTVEVDIEVLKKLLEAADALSEAASAAIHGADDPDARARLTKKPRKKAKRGR